MVRRDLALWKASASRQSRRWMVSRAVVGHLDADGVLAGNALDEDAFSAHGQAEVVGQAGDARVLDAGFGLELVGGDHGAGVDLDDLAAHVEFGAFLHQHTGLFAQFVLADGLGTIAGIQQRGGRQLEAADLFGRDGGGGAARRRRARGWRCSQRAGRLWAQKREGRRAAQTGWLQRAHQQAAEEQAGAARARLTPLPRRPQLESRRGLGPGPEWVAQARDPWRRVPKCWV
jgi:hypothetical protein